MEQLGTQNDPVFSLGHGNARSLSPAVSCGEGESIVDCLFALPVTIEPGPTPLAQWDAAVKSRTEARLAKSMRAIMAAEKSV